MHQKWTDELMKVEGLREKDILSTSVETAFKRQTDGLSKYYTKLYTLSDLEKDNLLLAPQFQMYSTQVRLSTFEKLNVLERETVNYYRSKIKVEVEAKQQVQSEQKDVGQLKEIMEDEKKELVSEKQDLEE